MQWLAPLASEAPELLVAGLFAWRLNTNAALGTLVSLEGEPVDAARRHAADRVRDLVGRAPRAAARRAAARGAVPHGGAVGLRGGGDLEPLDVAARGRLPVRAVLGPVPHRARSCRSRCTAVERIGVGILYLDPRCRACSLARARPASRRCSSDGFTASYDELAAERLTSGSSQADAAGDAAGTPGSLGRVDPRAFLDELTADTEIASSLVHVRELPARAPAIEPFPDDLPDLAGLDGSACSGVARPLPAPVARARGAPRTGAT